MIFDSLIGMPVYVNKHLCQMVFVRWRRSHRKSRINKKWQKKYGAVCVCSGHGYVMKMQEPPRRVPGGVFIPEGKELLIACPCLVRQLESRFAPLTRFDLGPVLLDPRTIIKSAT